MPMTSIGPYSGWQPADGRSEEHTSELQSRRDLVCRLLLEKKNNNNNLEPLVTRLDAMTHQCRDTRRIGAAALDICWLACGRLDCYSESVSPWDFAAARLFA